MYSRGYVTVSVKLLTRQCQPNVLEGQGRAQEKNEKEDIESSFFYFYIITYHISQ